MVTNAAMVSAYSCLSSHDNVETHKDLIPHKQHIPIPSNCIFWQATHIGLISILRLLGEN